jgi:PAS domain S-box-containing protein
MIPDDVGGQEGLGSLLAPRAEMSSLLRAERLILERVARGAPLADVLALLCAAFERHALGMCAIFLARGGRLYPAAGGGMPASLLAEFTDGIEIGPFGGACGNAAHRRQRFLAADVANDACFPPGPRDTLRRHGVVACTATPIISASGRLFGTFTVCHTRTFTPDADELGLIDRFVHLAGITIEREQVLAALRDSEAQHRSVVNALEEIIFHTDTDLRFTFLSAAVARVVGFAVEEALGRPALGFVHADDRASAAASMHSLLDLERESDEGELRIVARDGGPRWVRLRARPMLDAGGAVIGLSGSISDITERKKLEAQLLVSDRMASMGTLVAGVAHEINNPLASMMLNLDFIVRELHLLSDRAADGRGRVERLLEPIRAVAEGTERVRDIVKNLKIFSRGDERRGPVEIHPILESTIRMAANEIRHRAEVVRAYGRVPVVEANEASLGQVFLNLIVNAAHAIPEGDAEYHKIEVRTFTDEKGNAVVEINDSGAGIGPEHLQRIFDPFFTTKPLGVGTGLGLSICQRLVTGLGGTISVESQLGVGSTFRVVLPGSTRAVPQRRTPSQPLPVHVRGSVLVVDDEPIVGAAVRRMLAPLHDVTYVTSGAEALAQLDGGARFDVILCDLMMPGMTGMQLYDELRKRGGDLAARVVFITGGAFTPRAKSFLETVPNLVLDKPFEFKVLAAAINELLRSVAPGPG